MAAHLTIYDRVLGRVTWKAEGKCWEFDAGPINGESVPAGYIPEDSRPMLAEQGWERIRACVLWVRANEPLIQAFIKDWVDKFGAPVSLDLEPLRLSGIIFYKNLDARVIYDKLFNAVSVQVSCEGQIMTAPAWITRT
jgi:hypothetical protein